jgi:NADPH-dependent reductive aminase-like protein
VEPDAGAADANVLMMGATADHVVGANRSAGLDTALPDAVKSLDDRPRGGTAGMGGRAWWM